MAENDIRGFNQKIIEEFRANKGVVGGAFAGASLLLLGTTGAKSGAPRTNPLAYLDEGERLIVIASYAGSPANPPWYYNLQANPLVTVEVGTEKYQARADTVTEPDRSVLYEKMAAAMPAFAEYKEKTSRTIPVLALTRV